MKVLLPAAAYTFSATAKTLTFTSQVPASLESILVVENVTRTKTVNGRTQGVFYYLPQAGIPGTYASPVLTFDAATLTTGHQNTDRLQVWVEDGRDPALETGGNLAGIRADLGTDGTSPPTLPGSSTGVRGWLRYVASLIPASPFAVTGPLTDAQLRAAAVPVSPNVEQGGGAVTSTTQRVTLATDGPGVAALSSIDAKTPALVESTGTRGYDLANNLRQAVLSTSSAAVALPALGGSRELMLHPSTRCFIRFGDSNVAAATVGNGQLVIEPGERFHLRIPVGVTHFRVIRDTTEGFLNITAVL